VYLLGIASMQANRSHEPSLPSHIYRWDGLVNKLVHHQVLDAQAHIGAAISSMQVLHQGRETHLILTSFSRVECDNGSSTPLASGANTTATHSNTHSSTNTTSNTTSSKTRAEESKDHTVRILQWDRVTQKFDRLMALTDTDSLEMMGLPVPAQERRIHDASLSLSVQDTVHAEVVMTSGDDDQDLIILAISSVSSGLIMFEWRFQKAAGLHVHRRSR